MSQPALNIEDIKEELYQFFRKHFPTPAHLLAWIDDKLNDGSYNLHTWQAKIHQEHFSIEAVDRATQYDPLEMCLRAVNGSGKDEKVITPFVLHFIATNKLACVVLTSASGQQLKTQTERYLKRYGEALNVKLSRVFNLPETYEFFTVQQRYIKCNFTGGEAFLFATDEAGKAEGYHPTESNAKFAIVVNEGKSIAEDIWEALSRCNGFTHWIEISSPGKPDGHFFRTCTSSRTKSDNITKAVVQIVVTADDCKHLGGEGYVKRLVEIYGSRDHYMVKSMVDADFSSNDEQVVITYDKYNRLLNYQLNCEHLSEILNVGGLDLGFGGDEVRLQVRNGNKHLGGKSLISKDVNVICDTIVKWIDEYGLRNSKVYTDASGLGDPIISLLRGPVYKLKCIIPVKNNWVAGNEQAYKNLGTEMWFSLEKLIAEQEIIIKDEDVLRKQLCNRYYKINTDNTSQLESKQQARAKGRPSPDRADALVLCFYKYKTPAVKKAAEIRYKKIQELSAKLLIGAPTIRKLVEKSMGNSALTKYMQSNGIVNASRRISVMEKNELKLELAQAMRNVYGNT